MRYFFSSLFFFLICQLANTQIITTIAGTPVVSGYSGDSGPATLAHFFKPLGLAGDSDGNILVADHFNCVIRRISTAGIITTIGGTGVAGYSGDGGQASFAQFRYPNGIAIDKNNNIYISDSYNYVVRKINNAGIISTVAGNGVRGYSGDGGPATAARLSITTDIAFDNADNIYIVDAFNQVIRKIDAAGIISTFAGNGNEGYSGDGGPAISAKLNFPSSLAIDNSGNTYIGDDGNYVIRKVSPSGIITTMSGTGERGYTGDGGPAINAKLSGIFGLCFDRAGNLLFNDFDGTISSLRMIDLTGIITTIAGTGVPGYSGDGGPAILAQLRNSGDLVIDQDDNVLIADGENFIIRKVSRCLAAIFSSVAISASVSSVCKNSPIVFSASSINSGASPRYQWRINGVNSGNNSSVFTSSLMQDGDVVSCILISSISCTSPVSSNSIRVTVHPSPTVSAGQDVLIYPGSSIQLYATTTGSINSYQWSPPTGLTRTTIKNPVASPAITSVYRVEVISDKGCIASAAIKVVVYKRLYVPTAFTPNNDGKNDVFKIPDGTTISLKQFSVFDRVGNIVFYTNNPERGWDGTYKSAKLPAGVYVYIVEGSDPQGPVFEKGTVMLLR